MPSKDLLEQIKSLPLEEQRLIINNLKNHHLDIEGEEDDLSLYNLDIF